MNVEAKAESKMLGWQEKIYELLRQNHVTHFAYVPDAGHRVQLHQHVVADQRRTLSAADAGQHAR